MSTHGTPVTVAIIGAGSRGWTYSTYALAHPDRMKVVAVAEPRKEWRERICSAHGVKERAAFRDWRDLLEGPRIADAVIIATQDRMHVDPAVSAAKAGYHILLEKPMAPSADECRAIVSAVTESGVLFAVCHVLRYTNHTRDLKRLIADGAVGEVVNVQALEPVGYWHQAHSFVRGNWRREDESSPMLLAKCCHDIDWIRYLVDRPCTAVHSFGSLRHFRADEKPEGAAERCLDCAVEPECPYSAPKIYMDWFNRGERGWPLDVLTPEPSESSILEALRDGPYGRCVYQSDNDVVDNQVVSMQFEGGSTATLTMTAFTEATARRLRVFGTHGELESDGRTIRVFDFLSDRWTEHTTQVVDRGPLSGHDGGDYTIMSAFVNATHSGDSSSILSGPEDTLETHLMVFAAEESRRRQRVIQMR